MNLISISTHILVQIELGFERDRAPDLGTAPCEALQMHHENVRCPPDSELLVSLLLLLAPNRSRPNKGRVRTARQEKARDEEKK
jgi:hypothetical protein